ncbi:MAG TPA: hypothetical protein PLF13_11070 [candidate division Zixibacteria bacterium]|nr:hypothetical protein [candidate division Zixibacteria bacterium]
MKTKHALLVWGLLLLVGFCLVGSSALAKKPPTPGESISPPQDRGPQYSPQPSTVDMITHNKGNIVTTIDNFGYIGGYSYYGYPSGEWPRNSGHDYLAEIRYWMGAVTPSGDTLVANTVDDFQAMPMPVNGQDDYLIYLSTDSTRYYEYNTTDTVGLALGYPANGWRVWDPVADTYDYNQNYDPLATAYQPGGPTSLQESFYRFNDAASGSSLMGLELTHKVMQWNYCYNEDFTFVVIEITNTSDIDYYDFAVGLYIDIDVGGLDGTGENGRLGDMVAYDAEENLAWIYDQDGEDPGWGRDVTTGIMGTKYVETPDNIGMTSFRSGYWEAVSDIDDAEMYELISTDIFDESLPPTDQYYIQCTRGIDLTAGKTVRIVYALIAGADETEFRENAALAQELYDNNFIGPQPPATPVLRARAGDGKVYLSWTDTSEVSLDPMTGVADFVGYKLYRSDNQGKTWGTEIHNTGNDCLDLDYETLASYTIGSPGDPIQHSYIDTGLYNGVEYWYCLVAFDDGDSATGIDPLQSGFGVADEVSNTVSVTPTVDPAGFYDAAATIDHVYTGPDQPSDGTVYPVIFDESKLTGDEYQVVFENGEDITYWHLINVTTGDTLLAYQTRVTGEADLYEVAEGVRVVVRNGDRVPAYVGQTSFAGADTTIPLDNFFGVALPVLTGEEDYVWSDEPFRATYEFRYTGDSTRANWVGDGFYGTDYVYWVPYECWNTTTGQRVSMAIWDYDDNDVWDVYDDICIVNYPYDSLNSVTAYAFPYCYSWLFNFSEEGYNPSVGEVFTVYSAPLNGTSDAFMFTTDGVNAAAAATELGDIKAVPNPYYGRYSAMIETGEGESVIRFINLPDKCTIRIYTLSGDLVTTIDHDNGEGEAEWNLQSSNHQQVASGIYLFHVDSEYGERLGRFAVIK